MNKRNEILNALGKIDNLASPSLAALAVLNDKDVNQCKLVKTLELDPALTTNMLRFANSARYGFSRSIHSVNEAVVRLGLASIRRMIYLSMSSSMAQRPVAGYNLEARALWHHLVSSAVCTEILAAKTGTPASDAAFTAALLHDIGKLVLDHYLTVDADPILKLANEEQVPFNIAEEQILGISHAEVGAELLARWNLPEEIVEAVRWHHNPEGYAGDKRTVDFVHLADAISITAGAGLGVDGLIYTVNRPSERRMGVTVLIIEQVICDLKDETEKIEILT